MNKKKIIEFWRVISVQGAYYTLQNKNGEFQDFMRIDTICESLNFGDKVAVKYADGLRTIIAKVSDNVTSKEAELLLQM